MAPSGGLAVGSLGPLCCLEPGFPDGQGLLLALPDSASLEALIMYSWRGQS